MNTRYKASDAVEILKSVGVTDIEVGKMNSIVSFNSKGFFTESYLSTYDNGDMNFLQILPNDPKKRILF